MSPKSLFLLFICLFQAQQALASDNFISQSSYERVDSGIFERRDVQRAIGRFCRTLLLDPGNNTARENLKLLAAYPGLTAEQMSKVFLLEDLLHYIRNLKERVRYLTSKRDLLIGELMKDGYDAGMLTRDLFEVKSKIRGDDEEFMYPEKSLTAHGDPLMFAAGLLIGEKEQLLAHVEYLQEQYLWLLSYSPNITVPAVSENIIHVSSREYGKDSGPRGRPGEVVTEPIIVTPKISDASLAGKGERGSPAKENAALKQKDSMIEGLAQQVAALSLKVYEIEALLQEKISTASSLRSELIEVQQRFKLEQRLIREKNVKLMNELNGILEIYKLKLSDENRSAKEKAKSIEALHRQLAQLKNELYEKNETLATSQNDLRILKDQFAAMQTEFLELREHYQHNKPQNPEVENKLRELQSKFRDIQHFLLENRHDSDKINTHLATQQPIP